MDIECILAFRFVQFEALSIQQKVCVYYLHFHFGFVVFTNIKLSISNKVHISTGLSGNDSKDIINSAGLRTVIPLAAN